MSRGIYVNFISKAYSKMFMNQVIAVLLIVILVLPIAMIAESMASTISQPSTPDFTLKLINSSYDVPTTVTTDPYTGKNVVNEGSHVEAKTIEIRIKNEPFTSFSITEGTANWTVAFCYNIRWKGHYEQNWHEIYNPSDGFLGSDEGSETVYSNQGTFSSDRGLAMDARGMYKTFPIGAQIEFQVEAMIGYTHRVVDNGMNPWVFTGETSGWSSTQTITIGEATETATPGASQAPISPSVNPTVSQVSGLNWVGVSVIVLLVVIAVLLVFVVFYLRKRSAVGSVKTPSAVKDG